MSFEGAIGEIDLIQRLVDLGREQFTGAIRFEQDGIIKIVYFKAGEVLSASTNDRKDAVDEILLRAGKVSREHVKQALAKRKETETLGDALLNLGFITRKELTWARRIQVIGILRSVRSWTTGNYAIVADYLPKREEGTLFPLQQIVVEFIVTEQDRQTFDRAMDGGAAVFRKSARFDASFEKLGLNDEAAGITAQINGTHSAAEIVNTTGEEAFNVYKLLESLRVLGLIEKAGAEVGMKMEPEKPTDKPEVTDELSFESAGVSDAADAWSAPPEPPMQFDDEGPKVPFALKLDANQMSPPQPTNEFETGFDEAQIEMAARAAMPHPPMSRRSPLSSTDRKERRSGGLVFVLIVILLLAGIGAAGYMWWQGRQTPPPAPVAARSRPMIQPPPAPPPVTETVVPQTASSGAPAASGATTSTTTAATTTTTAPAPSPTPVPTPVQTSAAATKKAKAPTPAASSSVPPARLEQTETGTPMITNIPPGAPRMTPATTRPVPSSGGDRYAEMARQYAENPSGNFTVQFELVCQTSSLQKAMDGGGSSVWFVATTYQGKSCYRVFWGHYGTRAQAETAANQIPAALRGGKPAVVAVPR